MTTEDLVSLRELLGEFIAEAQVQFQGNGRSADHPLLFAADHTLRFVSAVVDGRLGLDDE